MTSFRQFQGVKRETPCSCGCGQRIPARDDVVVTVDMDSYPRKRYIPGHELSPSGSYRGKAEQKQESKPVSAPAFHWIPWANYS